MQRKFYRRYILPAFLVMLINNTGYAQVVNWSPSHKEDRHIVGTAFGADFGVVSSLTYGYKFNLRKRPVIAGAEYSFSYGEKMTDDWKLKLGGQIKLVNLGPVLFSARVQAIGRRYENDLVKMFNIGSDMALTGGYYRRRWFVAAETGFDKAIVTQITHTDKMRENYEYARNGWYLATGGNFYYGIQAGLMAGNRWTLYLRAGKMTEQDFKSSPTIPFYGQVGVNRAFSSGKK